MLRMRWLACMCIIVLHGSGVALPAEDSLGPGTWRGREPGQVQLSPSGEAQGRLPGAAAIPDALAGDVFAGETDGMLVYTLSAAGRRKWAGLLHPGGDGGGADVSGLELIQTRFLDSQCAFPTQCDGPCNIVLLGWTETTENTGEVNILLDGRLLTTTPGLPAAELPATHLFSILEVPAGLHVFRVEDAAGTTADEAGIEVLDAQPFRDVSDVKCQQGDVTGDGTCDLLVDWVNEGPFPTNIGVALDGNFLGVRPGPSSLATIPDVAPGEHCIELFGFTPFGEGSNAAYRGCFIQTCCTVTCEPLDCEPPRLPRICQIAYGPNPADNIVSAGWINGESPYAAGVNVLIDDAPRATLEGDDQGTTVDMLAPGQHELGIQGDCGPADGLSTITEEIFSVRTASPHASPITGDGLTCGFTPDPDGEGPETSVTTARWVPAAPSNFIDVYRLRDNQLLYAGTVFGNVGGVNMTGTLEGDRIALQFFATIDGECYASPFFECPPVAPPTNRYMQGLCNGTDPNLTITSAVFFLNYLFLGSVPEPPCLKACDANGDAAGNITDAVYILGYLFSGGPPPTLWVDSNDDGSPDPTCTQAAPEDDCEASHAVCG